MLARRHVGSSPLARGLRADQRPRSCPKRIIPARAGFTLRGDRFFASSTDHPRSRGVYRSPCAAARFIAGSSPLARGLQLESILANPPDGIIPARAGFTSSHPRTRGRQRDHPRSRGVYGNIRGYAVSRGGSSPLARGLLHLSPLLFLDGRIIPARAGFTECRRFTFGHAAGSSPLARGLLSGSP